MVGNHADIAVFDRLFAQVFRGQPGVDAHGGNRGDPFTHRASAPSADALIAPNAARSRHQPGTFGSSAEATDTGHGDDRNDSGPIAVPSIASDIDRLAAVDFGELQPHELTALAVLMHQLRLHPPLRSGRRSRRHTHGDHLDLRATLRNGPRTGGDPVKRIYRKRTVRPRRLVVLCDISGSMEPYARAYVQFLHASTALARAEVFTFATRLTRLTKAIAGSQPQMALIKAAATAPDWRAGTRIGEAIKTFLDEFGRRGLARGAVVIVISDGWEHRNPALLGEQMSRLSRLAHKVIWVNPRSADPGYAPLAGGMAAALPYCDDFLSGHNLGALSQVADAITSPRPLD
jgi:uncharacterized protein